MFKAAFFIAAVITVVCCTACSPGSLITPLSADQRQTALAETIQAGQQLSTTSDLTPDATLTPQPIGASMGQTVTTVPAKTIQPPVLTPTLTPSLTPVGAPTIPPAPVQIIQPGELSRVASPFQASTHLTSKTGKTVRYELFGEDGRLLVRSLRTFYTIPWRSVDQSIKLEFEIPDLAEAGRLVVSVEDENGRLMDVNSVNLILLSLGESDIYGSSAIDQDIVIQEPVPGAIVPNGNLVVTGLAHTDGKNPLRVQLITENGQVIYQRLAGFQSEELPGYLQFRTEVAVSVTRLTPVRLVVFEDGMPVSPVSHLSSLILSLRP